MTELEVISFAFQQNYHADKSNAAIHCSEVRFSPLTFRLAEVIHASGQPASIRVLEVMQHKGQYKEDAGRIDE